MKISPAQDVLVPTIEPQAPAVILPARTCTRESRGYYYTPPTPKAPDSRGSRLPTVGQPKGRRLKLELYHLTDSLTPTR